jgi:hypothetical protein
MSRRVEATRSVSKLIRVLRKAGSFLTFLCIALICTSLIVYVKSGWDTRYAAKTGRVTV